MSEHSFSAEDGLCTTCGESEAAVLREQLAKAQAEIAALTEDRDAWHHNASQWAAEHAQWRKHAESARARVRELEAANKQYWEALRDISVASTTLPGNAETMRKRAASEITAATHTEPAQPDVHDCESDDVKDIMCEEATSGVLFEQPDVRALERAVVTLLYLWTRDAKIDVSPDGSEWPYISNQIQHLGEACDFSDELREAWARGVFARLAAAQQTGAAD